MIEKIIETLKEIEEKKNVEILYACEAGSRVWGFDSKNSDWDVRFIYKNADLGNYLSLKETKDTIECTIDNLDIVGWDIKKALKLHYKSNPSLREWLISNKIYVDKGIDIIFDDLGGFNQDVLKNHYSGMAMSNWKKYCGLENQKDNAKKYLYVIRCILSWNLLDVGIDPPLSIHELLNSRYSRMSAENRAAVMNLISHLRYSVELSENTMFRLNNFIINSFRFMHKVKTTPDKDFGKYEERFKELLLVVR